MQLYACTKCDVVDSIELSFIDGRLPIRRDKQLCSECLSGNWHGLFEKVVFRPGIDIVINRPSNIGFG